MPEGAIGTAERVAANVVTSENREAFLSHRLDLAKPEPKPAAAGTLGAVAAAAVEQKAEAKAETKPEAKAEGEDPGKDLDAVLEEEKKPAPDEAKKQKFRERMSELATKRKEAEAKAAAETERAAKLERELAEERRARATPPAADEVGAAPVRANFATDQEYLEARDAHLIKKTRAEDRKAAAEQAAKAEAERAVRSYGERLAAVKAEVKDFDAVIEAAKDLPIPTHIQEAMLESEVGPRIAYYFAQHRDEHARITGLRPAAALRELGKIESMLESAAAPKETPKAAPAPKVEVSAAPPPISPVRGATGAIEAKVDSEGRFSGTYAEFKALRKAGKLK